MASYVDTITEDAAIRSKITGVAHMRSLLVESASLSSSLTGRRHMTLRESAFVTGTLHDRLRAKGTSTERIYASARLYATVRFRLVEQAFISSHITSGPIRSNFLESARVSSALFDALSARSNIVESASLSSQLSSITHAQFTETASVSSVLLGHASFRQVFSESAQVASLLSGRVGARSTFTETARVSSAEMSRVSALSRIVEQAQINGHVIEALSGFAWTASTDTFAMSRYTGFRFNSAARIGNRMIAAAPGGLYVLSGATDAGADINASLATGLSDVGDPQQKRMREVFIGYESSGTLQFKVSGTGTGTEAGYTYALPARKASDQVAGRTKIGRGMRSRFWRFELFSKLGQPFKVYESRISIDSLSRKI